MPQALAVEHLVTALISGDRANARDALRDAINNGYSAEETAERLIWPAAVTLDALWRKDQVEHSAYQGAVLMLSQLVQRLECGYGRAPQHGKVYLVVSGSEAGETLAGEIFSGLAEAAGAEVVFLGPCGDADDLYAALSRRAPDAFVAFASSAADAPKLRSLINRLRTTGAVPGLTTAFGGGVFARAPGLAEEMGADIWADDPFELVRTLASLGTRDSTRAVRLACRQRRRNAA
ncbi:MAG: hypothetical protein EXS10_02130 [Phycisphaerales bacterium]|nr:hypothetical protein [Phycisphaerales bacterium]